MPETWKLGPNGIRAKTSGPSDKGRLIRDLPFGLVSGSKSSFLDPDRRVCFHAGEESLELDQSPKQHFPQSLSFEHHEEN